MHSPIINFEKIIQENNDNAIETNMLEKSMFEKFSVAYKLLTGIHLSEDDSDNI